MAVFYLIVIYCYVRISKQCMIHGRETFISSVIGFFFLRGILIITYLNYNQFESNSDVTHMQIHQKCLFQTICNLQYNYLMCSNFLFLLYLHHHICLENSLYQKKQLFIHDGKKQFNMYMEIHIDTDKWTNTDLGIDEGTRARVEVYMQIRCQSFMNTDIVINIDAMFFVDIY